MSIVLDLLLAGIVVLSAVLAARRGFVRTVVEAVGIVAAVLLACSLGNPVASVIYDRTVEPAVETAVVGNLQSSAESVTDSFWNALPGYTKIFGLDKDSLSGILIRATGDTVTSAVHNASQTVVKPVVVRTLGLFLSLLFSIVFIVLARLLAKVLNKLFSFHLVGKVNTVLGFAVGLAKGICLAVFACLIVRILASLFAEPFFVFSESAMNGSFLYGALTGRLPFSF